MRHDHVRRERRALEYLPAVRADRRRVAEDGLHGRRAEAHDHLGLHGRHLGLEPAVARVDLDHVGLGVEAPLAARLPLEVLHGVRDVDVAPIHAGTLERRVEHAPRGADERAASSILDVPGLLADEHDRGGRVPFAEDRLCGVLVEVARGARTRRARELHRVRARRHERERRRGVGHLRLRHVATRSKLRARRERERLRCSR